MFKRGGDLSEPLATIEEEAQRAAQILADFLQFSRPADLAIKPVKGHELLRKVLDNARARLKDRAVVLELGLETPPDVAGSERHLIQVFTNLVNNAIEAMPLGGRLTVSVRSGGGKAEFRIADTGIGIPADRLPGLFEPFSTSKGDQGGHGLGLSIARWIVEQHSGELRAESEGVNRGSAFTVVLPLS
jgi:signal transduction histidine kinase